MHNNIIILKKIYYLSNLESDLSLFSSEKKSSFLYSNYIFNN